MVNLDEVRVMLLSLIKSQGKKLTINEIKELVDHRAGDNIVRLLLEDLVTDKKLVRRKYKHNLFKYSIE